MPQQSRTKTDKILTDLLLDGGIFLAFILAMDPHTTGNAIHEWLSIALAAAIFTHLLLHWNWIVSTTRRFFAKTSRQSRVNYVLNTLLFIDFTLITFTGLMISKDALPALGIQVEANFLWRRLHDVTAQLSLILIGLHVALHCRWIVATTKRYLLKMVKSAHPTGSKKEVQL